jgi:hypothetical protein
MTSAFHFKFGAYFFILSNNRCRANPVNSTVLNGQVNLQSFIHVLRVLWNFYKKKKTEIYLFFVGFFSFILLINIIFWHTISKWPFSLRVAVSFASVLFALKSLLEQHRRETDGWTDGRAMATIPCHVPLKEDTSLMVRVSFSFLFFKNKIK